MPFGLQYIVAWPAEAGMKPCAQALVSPSKRLHRVPLALDRQGDPVCSDVKVSNSRGEAEAISGNDN